MNSSLSEFFINGKNFKHYPNKFSSECFYNINTPVLKCRLYYYSGRVRLTDQEASIIEKMVYYSEFPVGGAFHALQDEHQGWLGG